MKEILIIDDDVHIGDMLSTVLEKEGYKTKRAYSGSEAILLLTSYSPDLALLDLMLPGLPGEEVIKKINAPTIVLSAKIDTESKVNLLLDGAVDYLTKPFEIKELLARIQVAFRKSAKNTDEVLTYTEIKLNTANHQVSVNNEEIKLTRTEYAILKILMINQGQVITKSQILDSISEDTPDCSESSLKIHISNLRKKLKSINDKDYIEAIWGIGFKLK